MGISRRPVTFSEFRNKINQVPVTERAAVGGGYGTRGVATPVAIFIRNRASPCQGWAAARQLRGNGKIPGRLGMCHSALGRWIAKKFHGFFSKLFFFYHDKNSR